MLTDNIFNWLETALDYGISEYDFWNMTIAELERSIASKKRVRKLEAQEKASYDYLLAELIGRSIARIYSSSARFPAISEVYPTLFDNLEMEEKKKEKQMEASAIRFKQFAQSYNQRFKGVAKDKWQKN